MRVFCRSMRGGVFLCVVMQRMQFCSCTQSSTHTCSVSILMLIRKPFVDRW